MRKIFLNRAIAEAVGEEMKRDERVILVGEDMHNLNGGLSTFINVPQKFPDRCLDMPIAELGFTHFAAGAAMNGHRPIVDLMFSSFSTLACDSIINVAAKYRYCTLGKRNLPVVYMMGNGSRGIFGGWSSGCNHDQCMEPIFQSTAGLKIAMPYYPEDVKGLLKASIRDDDPVVFFYHLGSLGMAGEVSEEDFIIPLNNAAKIMKEGSDVTIIGIQATLQLAMEAADKLKEDGIEAEVIDPRVLIPLDKDKICKSAQKTGRVIIVHEAPVRGGVGGEIAAVIAENCTLKGKIKRIGQLASPGPVGPSEYMMQPKAEQIIAAAKELCR